MDAIVETPPNLDVMETLVAEGNIEAEMRMDWEVELLKWLDEEKKDFSTAIDLINSPTQQKREDKMVKVQNRLTRILWCFDKLNMPPVDVDPSTPEYEEAMSRRYKMEEAVRGKIFDKSNPNSWVNVKGEKAADENAKQLYGVVSTLTFLRLMSEVDKNFSHIRPSQLISLPEVDIHNKVDLKWVQGDLTVLIQLKSGELHIDEIPRYEESGVVSSNSSLITSLDESRMRQYADKQQTTEVKIFAVRVPSFGNGREGAVNMFGEYPKDSPIQSRFRDEAKASRFNLVYNMQYAERNT